MSDIATQDLAQLLQSSRGYEPFFPSDPAHQSPPGPSVQDPLGLAIVLIPQDALNNKDGITVHFSAEGIAVHRRRPAHTQRSRGIPTPPPTLQSHRTSTLFNPEPAALPTAPSSPTPSQLRGLGSNECIRDSSGSPRLKHMRRSRARSDASTASVPSSQILEMELVSPKRTVSKPDPTFNSGQVSTGLESLGTQWETEPRVADDDDSETEPEAEPDDEWTALLMKRVFAHAAAEGALTSFKRKRQ